MIYPKTMRMLWDMLDARERRNFWLVVTIVCVSGLFTVLMIASIMPFLTVLSDPSQIYESRLLNNVFTWGGFENEFDFLVALGGASIAVIIISNLLQILKTYAIARFSEMRRYSLSTRLLSRYMHQPYEFFLARHSSDLGKQMMTETQQVVTTAIRPAMDSLASVVTASMIAALLLVAEPVVTLATFGLIGSIYGGVIFLNRRFSSRLGAIRKEANAACFKVANEALSGIKDIKITGREGFYLRTFSKPALRMARSQMNIMVITQSPQYIIHALMFSGIVVLCLALLIRGGSEADTALAEIIPTIGLLAFAGQRILPELSRLFHSITMISYAGAAVETLHADLVKTGDAKENTPNVRSKVKPMSLRGEIEFKGLSYRYPAADRPGLADLSFRIQAGERIGIVGSTGSGKSTFANVLMGLLAPSAGYFAVDGVQITEATVPSWQRTIGYVPQDIFLTDTTVRENIALGLDPAEVDMARVVSAAKIAQIHEFIESEMPQGYDTMVGERGVRLSGGQRQRLGIARALYNRADLIVFDEATSALDNATEKDVIRAIDSLPGDKTLVMIAHRLSTLTGCDRILVLDKGHVVGFDTWEALENGSPEFRSITRSVSSH